MTPHFRKQPARQLGALCLAFEHRARVLPLGAGQRRQSERPTEISRPPGYRREPRHPALVPAAVPPCPGPAGTDPASRRFSGTSLLRGTRGVPLLDQRDRREPWSNAAPPAPPQRPPPAGTAHAPRTPAGPPLPLPDHTSAAPRSSMSRSPPTTSCLELDRPRTSGTSEGAPRSEKPTSRELEWRARRGCAQPSRRRCVWARAPGRASRSRRCRCRGGPWGWDGVRRRATHLPTFRAPREAVAPPHRRCAFAWARGRGRGEGRVRGQTRATRADYAPCFRHRGLAWSSAGPAATWRRRSATSGACGPAALRRMRADAARAARAAGADALPGTRSGLSEQERETYVGMAGEDGWYCPCV